MNKNVLIVTIVILLAGMGFFVLTKQYSKPSPSLITTTTEKVDNWKVYINTDYSFQIDYPSRFHFVENANLALGDKVAIFTSSSNAYIAIRVIHDIDVYKNKKPEDVAKREIMDSGYKYSIIGVKTGDYSAAITTVENNLKDKYPIITIAHPSKNLFIELEVNIQNNSSQGESDKILSSFKFLDNSSKVNGHTANYDRAVKILQAVPEVQIIENAVIKNGRKTSFSSAGGENGDVVTVLLFEGGFPDQHTTRIDTFMVNVKTNEIQVYDATSVPNKNFSLEEWKKTVKERFE